MPPRTLLACLVLALPACKPTAAPPPSLTIFAAASLREAFTALATTFSATHPGVSVTFNFAGSQELRVQVEQGAPADLFASADRKHMAALHEAGKVDPPTVFARNEPVVIIARRRADTLRAFADLPNAERIVIGAPDVPIGRYADQILGNAARVLGDDFRARVLARVVSRELNVRHVLAKVSLDEADAGIVYRTDVAPSGQDAAPGSSVSVVTIPPELNVMADYPIAVVTLSPHRATARAFLDLVVSSAGQTILARYGFLTD